MNRKKGDTTFKQCGWCEHASCGSVRYGCYLSTRCSLLKRYGIGSDVFWDTACIVNHLGKADFDSVISSKKYQIEENKRSIEYAKKEIAVVKTLASSKVKKPPLPNNRVCDYYNIGDIVLIFCENKWNRGIVVPGYLHHDGCVSYVLDDYPKSKKGWGCGYSVPCVLKKWEYRYFQKNLKDFQIWLNFSDKEYNGKRLNLDAYYQAIAKANNEKR